MMHVQHNGDDSSNKVKTFENFESEGESSFDQRKNKREKSLVERVNEREDLIAYHTRALQAA